MPSTSSLATRLSRLKPGPRNRLLAGFVVWAVLGPLLALGTSLAVLSSRQEPVDVHAEITSTNNAQNWARSYLLLWLGGSAKKGEESPNLRTLQSMTSAPVNLELPQTAYAVQDISPVESTPTPVGNGDMVWRMRMAATVVVPGSSSVNRLVYDLDMMEHAGTFRATALPRIVTTSTTPFQVDTAYSSVADVNSALGQSAQAFASAYLTPASGGNLGSTVGPDFDGQAVVNSPYRKVEVTGVAYVAEDSSFDINNVKAGDTVHALITVKAETSSTTFNITQLPVVMVVLNNGQWVVDSFEPYVNVGAVRAQHDSGAAAPTSSS